MGFKLGQPRPPNAGRKTSTPNRQTELARQGVKSALQICREGGDDPISIMMNAARFLNSVAAAYAPKRREGTDLAEIIKATPRADLEFMRRFLLDAALISRSVAEFGYAKLTRVDHVGDVPAATIENKLVFTLNLEKPGRSNDNGMNGDDEFGDDGSGATIDHSAND